MENSNHKLQLPNENLHSKLKKHAMFIKFNTAVLLIEDNRCAPIESQGPINPQDFAINTANIVSILRIGTNSLVINTNATITKFPLTQQHYPTPLTYTITFESKEERDRIFNKLIHSE